jgi:hypothetical protein
MTHYDTKRDSIMNASSTSKFPKKYPKPKPSYKIMEQDSYEFIMRYCTIRPNKQITALAREETAWTIDIGIFKDYVKDNSMKLEAKCFEFDWENMKVLKYKNSSDADVKEEMWKVYPALREAYKVQAGYSPNGNVFSIGMN